MTVLGHLVPITRTSERDTKDELMGVARLGEPCTTKAHMNSFHDLWSTGDMHNANGRLSQNPGGFAAVITFAKPI